jgi:KDO2-lipid IV(A) lauroyltransferase
MKYIKYFLQFLFISCLLILFKIVGLKFSRIIASKLFSIFGPFFRSKKIIEQNISFAFNESDKEFKKVIINNMWKSYGKFLLNMLL